MFYECSLTYGRLMAGSFCLTQRDAQWLVAGGVHVLELCPMCAQTVSVAICDVVL